MDAAKRQAIAACGRCGLPERDHQHQRGEDPEAISVLVALGGPCPAYVASDASLRYQQHLALAARPSRLRRGQRAPLCSLCGYRGHPKEDCPF